MFYASVISLFPLSGGYGGRVTPDSIPNSEVKPACADGTAGLSCGRVGRCRSYFEAPQTIFGGLFLCEKAFCLPLLPKLVPLWAQMSYMFRFR